MQVHIFKSGISDDWNFVWKTFCSHVQFASLMEVVCAKIACLTVRIEDVAWNIKGFTVRNSWVIYCTVCIMCQSLTLNFFGVITDEKRHTHLVSGEPNWFLFLRKETHVTLFITASTAFFSHQFPQLSFVVLYLILPKCLGTFGSTRAKNLTSVMNAGRASQSNPPWTAMWRHIQVRFKEDG